MMKPGLYGNDDAIDAAVCDALRRRMAGESAEAVLGHSLAEHEKQLRRYAGHWAPNLIAVNRHIGPPGGPDDHRLSWTDQQIADGTVLIGAMAPDGSFNNIELCPNTAEDSGGHHLAVFGTPLDVEGVPVWHSYTFHLASILTGFPENSKYWLYRIRFSVDADAFDEKTVAVLSAGYWGITVTAVTQRWSEHQRDAFFGKGHLLHRVWSGLLRARKPFSVWFTLQGCGASLDEIYREEEAAVAADSLAPKGLNAIPGGHAGIKMLHELSLLSGKRLPALTERDRAIALMERKFEQRMAAATHYRRGHFRQFAPGRNTWVSPCWVNAQAAA
jgi:hypothetical protein